MEYICEDCDRLIIEEECDCWEDDVLPSFLDYVKLILAFIVLFIPLAIILFVSKIRRRKPKRKNG